MTQHLIVTSFLFISLLFSSLALATPQVVEIHGVEVLPTKTNGETWDVGFGVMIKPDLQIRLSQTDQVLWQSPKMMNTYSNFRVHTTPLLELDITQSLVIEVLDRDLRHTDVIEKFELSLAKASTKDPQTFTLSGKSVIRLKLVIKTSKEQKK